MTDKTIYWNGANGKRSADDEPTIRTHSELLEELTAAVSKLADANDYTRRVIDSIRARLDRLEAK